MNDLQKLQKHNSAAVDPAIHVRLVEDFPVNDYMQGAWKFSINEKYKMGFLVGFNTTGSRIHYADYTGELSYEIVAKAFNFGIELERLIFQAGRFDISIDADFSMYSSVIKSRELLIILNNSSSTSIRYESISPTFEPGLSLNYSIKPFLIGLHAGYLLDPGARLFWNYGDPKPALTYESGNSRSNWTGFRIGVAVGFVF
jgi:hypothetical protein